MAAGTSPIIPELPIIRTRRGEEQRATFFELFFDLVYVFAVTQLSHHLLADITWTGGAETAFMLVALYWAWNYTTWMTNWFDPDTVPVRLTLVFVMVASLLMAVAILSSKGAAGVTGSGFIVLAATLSVLPAIPAWTAAWASRTQ